MLLRLAGHAVRIAERELAFVTGSGLEIQNAPGEAFRHCVRHALAFAVYPLPPDPKERQRGTPSSSARFPESNVDARVAICVTFDRPFEAEVQQRRVFDMEAAGLGDVLGRQGTGDE